MSTFQRLVLAALLAGALACQEAPEAGPVTACAPATQAGCDCDGGGFGTKACLADGSGFGDCICAPPGMVTVPEGTAWSGCNEVLDTQCAADEKPQAYYWISAFFIDRTEVTAADYAACVAAGGCVSPALSHPDCSLEVAGREDWPINCVNFPEAEAYCAWAGKRLPTEAEWEKAARGGCDRRDECQTATPPFPWGTTEPSCDRVVMQTLPPAGPHEGCSTGGPMPVGSRPQGESPYGAVDMAGNVREWVSDWYAADAYAWQTGTDPKGAAEGTLKIRKGGSYKSVPEGVRTSGRGVGNPTIEDSELGIRCAK